MMNREDMSPKELMQVFLTHDLLFLLYTWGKGIPKGEDSG